MSYIENNLIAGEEVLIKKHLSAWILGPFIVFGCLLLPVMGIGLLLLIYGYFYWKKSEVSITNKRFLKRTGVFFTKTQEIRRDKIESVDISESLFKYGMVKVSGTGGKGLKFPVNQINEFRKIVQDVSDK